MMLVGCVLHSIDSEVIQRRHPHLLSLAKDVKRGKYTVPTGTRTSGRPHAPLQMLDEADQLFFTVIRLPLYLYL